MHHKLRFKPIQFIAILLIAIFILSLSFSSDGFHPETILERIPANPFLGALAFLFLYALKSISVIFPIIALEIAAGILYPLPFALIINILGMSIVLTLPYWLARRLLLFETDTVFSRFPQVKAFFEKLQSQPFLLCFLLRSVGCLPMDIVSMTLGIMKIPFSIYFSASMAGSIAGVIAVTLLGRSILHPGSWQFIATILLNLTLSVSSWLLHRRIQRHH